MQNFVYTFVVVLLLSTMGTLYAQEVSFKGNVTDDKGKVVVTATISLLKSDSSWLQSDITDDNGDFTFKKIAVGKYIVAVNATGYKALMQAVEVKEKMDVVKFSIAANTTLQEVVITDKLPKIEKGLGKMTINFQQGAGQGESVLDLLRKSPGVNVNNGDISLKGSSALVLVDDKETYMSGKDLEDYLKSLPAGQIAALELITQPSAKYDAEGGSIINIKTKKIRKRGINGNLSTSYEQGKYANTHNNANLTYRRDKLTVYTNAGYMAATSCLDRNDERKVIDESMGIVKTQTKQSDFMKETFSDANLKLGTDYSLSDKVTIGGSVKGVYHPNKEGDDAQTILKEENGNTTYNNTEIGQGLIRKNVVCNAYAKYKPAKEQEISVDVDYLYRNQQGYQVVNSSNYDANIQPLQGQNLRDHKSSIIEVPVAKIDYSASLPKNWKIEAGIKCGSADLDKDEYFEAENNGTWAYDSTRSNHFLYTETISAAYASVNKPFGKKWNTQLGLRAENTISKGNQVTQSKEFDREYTSVFQLHM